MITARITHQSAPRRSLLDRLLLDGMAWTDARSWFGFVGLAAMIVLMGVLEQSA